MIPRTDGRKARLAKAGQMKGEGASRSYAAGLFLYDSEDVGVEMRHFLDEPLAVNIPQLRERCERLPAVHRADGETIRIGLRRRREGKCEERVLIVLFENDDGPGEFAALAVSLVSDVLAQPDPPNLTFPKVEACGFLGGIGAFLDAVPAVEIVRHR